ncbi:unnamed protein product [Nezara viridula]|uniref:Uncharacterized protein n=1 Tax=Nezara viridula TaxID=85310 RepID=A0A9P0H4S4_NEZVI|nr:unnamed protein product [Nezara viridula]
MPGTRPQLSSPPGPAVPLPALSSPHYLQTVFKKFVTKDMMQQTFSTYKPRIPSVNAKFRHLRSFVDKQDIKLHSFQAQPVSRCVTPQRSRVVSQRILVIGDLRCGNSSLNIVDRLCHLT